MPRNQRGEFEGNFGSYASGNKAGNFPDDEQAVDTAIDTAFSCCGNAGQETLIGDIASDFDDWANDVLEGISDEGETFEDFLSLLSTWYEGRADKVNATQDIWQQAWEIIAGQSGYHDREDEKRSDETGTEF